MTVREYIGARYIPLFADPIEWDNTLVYEPLTVVKYQGASYVSRRSVPEGIALTNTDYWILWADYNAQIEAYRQEVQAFDGRITANTEDIEDVQNSIETLQGKFPVATSNVADGAISWPKLGANVQGAIKRAQGRTFANDYIVFIGDSYGRGVGGKDGYGWPTYAATYLHPAGYTNVSNSGAGFVAQGHSQGLSGLTFATQLTYAAQHLESGITPDDVTLVIIGGGYNDHAASEIYQACRNCISVAKKTFPNAQVLFFPLCVGDRELTAEYAYAYGNMVRGCSVGGAQVFAESLYWLYGFQLETSAGDEIHPNDVGYIMIGRNIAGSLYSGNIPPFTEVYAASAEGYETAENVTNVNFRAGIQNGFAWYGGEFTRKGKGILCTLPSYCRPKATRYIPCFVYADSTHEGFARLAFNSNGTVEFFAQETGTYDATLTYRVFIPFTVVPLGHVL